MKNAKRAKTAKKGAGKKASRALVPAKSQAVAPVEKSLRRITEGNVGWYRLLESYSGAWQNNVEVDLESALTYFATFACMTLIASDIAKLRVKIVKRIAPSVWVEVEGELDELTRLLRKPNPMQTRIQFWESWLLSKLKRGNTYILKVRNRSGRIVALYVLDPDRVTPLVADDGSVFYELAADNVAGIMATITVPAREIIHDRFNTLYHPLVGMSPIEAGGIAAMQGLAIQSSAAAFFTNSARPGGILTAPGEIGQATVDRLKAEWAERFSGQNSGKVAVLGDGLTFVPMAMTAVESQQIEQSKWTAEVVCSVFHVPRYKIGIGEIPKYDSIQALNVEYYTQALQSLIEAAEICLDEGLEIEEPIGGVQFGAEFDLDGLLRMDSAALFKALGEGVLRTILTPNEARSRAGYGPKEGGDSLLAQEQNYSLAALAKRDERPDPFAALTAPAAPPLSLPPPDDQAEEDEKAVLAAIMKGFEEAMKP